MRRSEITKIQSSLWHLKLLNGAKYKFLINYEAVHECMIDSKNEKSITLRFRDMRLDGIRQTTIWIKDYGLWCYFFRKEAIEAAITFLLCANATKSWGDVVIRRRIAYWIAQTWREGCWIDAHHERLKNQK